jgi:pyruvate/2-oxoglutarate dehydrogenase complex dihydrolipoamide acyltransferase (E2) component
MATDVRVPTAGNAGEDAVVLEWNVTEGSDVTAGDVPVTLETGKATIDVEAPISGHVLRTFRAAADEVGEHAARRHSASPRARKLAGEFDIDLTSLAGTDPMGRIIIADVVAAQARATPAAPPTPQPVPTPPAINQTPPAEMEWEFFVTPEDILDAIHTRVLPLSGHQIQEGPGAEGTLEESRLGI